MSSLPQPIIDAPLHLDVDTLESMAEALGFAFFTVNSDEQVGYWSESAERWFGRSPPSEVFAPFGDTAARHTCEVTVRDGRRRLFRRLLLPFFVGTRFSGGFAILTPVGEPGEVSAAITHNAAFAASLTSARRALELGLPVYVEGEPGTERLDVARALAGEVEVLSAITLDAATLSAALADTSGPTMVIDEPFALGPAAQEVLRAAIDDRCGAAADPRADRTPRAFVCIGTTDRIDEAARGLAPALLPLRLVVPPLRDRPEDIELHTWASLAHAARHGGRRVTAVAPDAWARLRAHRWPNNLTGLRVAILHAWVHGTGSVLAAEDLVLPETRDARTPVDRHEAERVRRALEQADGCVSVAASRLGMSRSTLWRHRRKLGV